MTPEPDTPSESEPRASGGGWGLRLAVGLTLGVLVWAGLIFYADVEEISIAGAALSPRVLLLALVISTLNYFVRAYRWQLMLRTVGVRIPLFESVVVFLAGLSMTLTPMKVGEILKSALLKQSRDIPIATTAPVVVAERITDLASMVLLASIGSLAIDKGGYVAIVGGGFVATIVLVCTVPSVGEWVFWLCDRIPVVRGKTKTLRTAYDNLGALVRFTPFMWATFLGLIAWSTHCIALLIVVRSFPDMTFGLADSLFAYSTPLLAGTLSMLPGGLGLTEASMTGLLEELGGPGMTVAIAAAVTIAIRLVTFWWAILVGVASLALWRRIA